MYRVPAVTTLLVVGAALAFPLRAQTHPLPGLIGAREAEVTIPLKVNGDSAPTAPPVTTGVLRATIGLADGDPGFVFGAIEDIALGAQGEILVLDSRFNDVRAFSADGELLYQFGQPGDGPLEFRYPKAVAVTASGKVVVLDRASLIKVFTVIDREARLERSIRLEFVPDDLCTLDELLFVRAGGTKGTTLEPSLIHVYSFSGEHLRSFGQPYNSSNWMVRRRLSAGRIACDPENKVIIAMFDRAPYVFGYSVEGELLWTTELEGLRFPPLIEGRTSDGRPTLSYGEGTDALRNLIVAPDGVLIQIDRVAQPEMVRPTFRLEAVTGNGELLGENFPEVVLMADDLSIVRERNKFPRIQIYGR